MRSMCGTTSCIDDGTRATHVSGGSVRWVSTSMTATRSKRSVLMGSQSQGGRADLVIGFEGGDLICGETEVGEDLVVVLAEHRRRRVEPAVDAGVAERQRRVLLRPDDRVVEVLVVVAGDELRVLRAEPAVVHGRGRHACADEQVDRLVEV